MAIKITGTTVINDSREIENVNDINRFIQQPEITSPADGDIDVALDVTIQGTPYSPLYTADTRDYREFQVDLQSGDFSTPERSNQVDSDSWVIDPILDPNESYKIRIRDVSVNGTVSEWSEEVAFTSINVFVDEPTVSVEDGPSDVPENPTISTSAFSVTNGSDTHESTDWEVIRTSDSVTVFESLNDTSNLTSITVTTSLDESTEYEFRARHNGATFGSSAFGSVTATTLASFAPTTFGESYEGGFYMGTIAAAGTTYYLLVAPNATGCACCQWKTSNTSTSGTCSFYDGYANTYPALENSTHPAGNWTATRTIDGFSDWYLPAYDELEVFYNNGGGNGAGDPLPSGEDFATAPYWSSTDVISNIACAFYFGVGPRGTDCSKDYTFRVRAVRRVPI
jgi:hypothetical protein